MKLSFTQILISLIFFPGLTTQLLSQDILINEIMPLNASVITDEDGDFSDWIELYNPGSSSQNLQGFGLSDDITVPLKWHFPEISINAGEYLLLFASGKDKPVAHWETIIDWGDDWKFLPGSYEPPINWNTVGFDDSQWSAGPSGFGYGDNDDSTIVAPTISLYVRKSFTIPNINNIISIVLHVDFDDAFVAYINGIEVARENIGTPGIPPAFNETSITYTEPLIVNGNDPYRFSISDFQSFLNTGENVLAIQVHNTNISSSDLSLIPFLSLGMESAPINAHGSPAILSGLFPQMHTNFKIKSSGETILLSDTSGIIIDQIEASFIPADISFGRPIDSINWYHFFPSSPGGPNLIQNIQELTGIPEFSLPGGIYQGTQHLSISGTSAYDSVFYTLDCSEPTTASIFYSDSFEIISTSVIKAKIIKSNALPGNTITQSYIINENISLPVVSISTPPTNLWNIDTGIHVEGNNADPNFPYFGANFWEDWERPIHLELFESIGQAAIDMDAGVKIFGGWSRGFPQKSLALYARSKYGYGSIDYQIFEGKDINNFESIILRNSGNDWPSTMFRDAMMTSLVKDIDIDRQAYKPTVVFLNGAYWGILNLREKINEHFISSNHPWVDNNNIDFLEFYGEPIQGDNAHYSALIDFVSNNDLTIPENFTYVKSLMDINEFMNYQVAQIYFNNQDWPGNNIKFWRPKVAGGKWRWIMYDTDFGFGIWNPNDYTVNTLAFALETNGPEWPNPPWSTILLRRLTQSMEFRIEFVNRFADLFNTIFAVGIVNTHIDSLKSKINTDMPRHIDLWNVTSLNEWNQNIQTMKNFANNRISFMRSHIQTEFGLPGVANTTIDVSISGAGEILLNSITLKDFPWTGGYFKNNPIKLSIIPKPGYKFVGWTGITPSSNPVIQVNLSTDVSIIAQFEEDPSQEGSIVINEINYNSSPGFNPEDWIELYNSSTQSIDISNWIFKDSDNAHQFNLPANLSIESGEYLVLCRDSEVFANHFPQVKNFLGDFDFGLSSSGELIRLFDENNTLIDFVEYESSSPWPTEPNGNGPTLELKDPYFDNTMAENWYASFENGTPGAVNSTFYNENILYSVPDLAQSKSLMAYPNPFTDATNIQFKLSKSEHVSVIIYDLNGVRVDVLFNGRLSSGHHQFTWKGTNKIGNSKPAGVYFIQFNTERSSSIKKLVLLD